LINKSRYFILVIKERNKAVMLKITTAKEMQDIDRITIKKYGIAGSVLMDNAGLAMNNA
jgi:hypothetical protein